MNVPKSVVRIAGVISLWLVTGCMAEAASAQPQQEPYALIYNGPVSDGDSTKAIAGIQIISATLMDEWREVANC